MTDTLTELELSSILEDTKHQPTKWVCCNCGSETEIIFATCSSCKKIRTLNDKMQ